MLSLKTEPDPSALEQLLSECFQLSDAFSLTDGPRTTPGGTALLHRLRPYWLGTFKTQHWFCYYVPEGYKKRVFLFRSCAESIRIVMDSYRHLIFATTSSGICRKIYVSFPAENSLWGLYPTKIIAVFILRSMRVRADFKTSADGKRWTRLQESRASTGLRNESGKRFFCMAGTLLFCRGNIIRKFLIIS